MSTKKKGAKTETVLDNPPAGDIGLFPPTEVSKTEIPFLELSEGDEIDADYRDAAPSAEYIHQVIGETMKSVCGTLRGLSLHDVLLMFPQLIEDIVNEAYVKGYQDGKK